MSKRIILPETSENMDLSECISILDFISSIQPNDKPCYKTKTTISKQDWLIRIRRRWAGETGENGVLYVNKLLCSCDIQYRMCLKNPKIEYDNAKLYLSLKNSIPGFSNLINTYSDQKNVSENYDKIKNRVISLCNQIENLDNPIDTHNKHKNAFEDNLSEINETEKNETELMSVTMPENSNNNFFTANNIRFISTKDVK